MDFLVGLTKCSLFAPFTKKKYFNFTLQSLWNPTKINPVKDILPTPKFEPD